MQQCGWYTNTKTSAKWQQVQKIAPIYAINYDVAKIHGIVNNEDVLLSNEKHKVVNDTYMICKDIDGNLWAEPRNSFKERYTKTDETDGYWRKYTPTEDAINLAKIDEKRNLVQMQSLDKKNKWNLTQQEFHENYVPNK